MTVELQDIFQQHYKDIASQIGTYEQYKVVQAIMGCRKGAYGGRIEQCPECNHTSILYNSCRNRHCSKCQTLAKERWIDARREDLLPVSYFHVVFTVPEELNVLIMQNQKVLYTLLFDSVAQTLAELVAVSNYLGVQLGFTSILHTWGQNLLFHPHLHVVIPNGGLTPHGTFKEGHLQFHGSIAHLEHMQYFAPLPAFSWPGTVSSEISRIKYSRNLSATFG